MASSKSASIRNISDRSKSRRSNVTVACDPCRLAKRKCEANRPCRSCIRKSIACVSVSESDDGRRKRHTMAELAARVDALFEILDLEEGNRSVSAVLQAMQSDEFVAELARIQQSHSRTASASSTHTTDDPLEPAEHGESYVTPEVGSPSHGHELSTLLSLDEGNGLPGYVGKLAPAAWLLRAHEHISDGRPTLEPEPLGQVFTTMGLNYYIDHEDILAVNEDYIDAQSLPPWSTALMLSEAYFWSLQGTFQFVQSDTFYPRLRNVYQTVHSTRSWEDRKFLSLANMMWSFGSWWLAQTNLGAQADALLGVPPPDSHLSYYARTRSLGLDHRVQIDHPCVDMVDGMAILSLYLLVNGSVQRAWITAGQAVRCAIALGLHLQPHPRIMSRAELKRRSRTWYSLYRLETFLSQITGRPGSLRYAYSTISSNPTSEGAALGIEDNPSPLAEASAVWQKMLKNHHELRPLGRQAAPTFQPGSDNTREMNEHQFAAAIDLYSIGDKIANSLYLSPIDLTWADVQNTVRGFEAELTDWQQSLPNDLKFHSRIDPGLHPVQLDLYMYSNSLKVVLYRSFLCDIQITEESSTSAAYNQGSARACIDAAIKITNMLPEQSTAHEMFRNLPWLALLHYICQVCSVFIIALSLRAPHMKDQEQDMLSSLRRALACLRNLAPSSKSAYKAWHILQALTRRLLKRYPDNLGASFAASATMPERWVERDQIDLLKTLESL